MFKFIYGMVFVLSLSTLSACGNKSYSEFETSSCTEAKDDLETAIAESEEVVDGIVEEGRDESNAYERGQFAEAYARAAKVAIANERCFPSETVKDARKNVEKYEAGRTPESGDLGLGSADDEETVQFTVSIVETEPYGNIYNGDCDLVQDARITIKDESGRPLAFADAPDVAYAQDGGCQPLNFTIEVPKGSESYEAVISGVGTSGQVSVPASIAGCTFTV